MMNRLALATELIGDVIEVREGQEEMNFGAAGISVVKEKEEETGYTFLWDKDGIHKVEDETGKRVTLFAAGQPLVFKGSTLSRVPTISEKEMQEQLNDEWYVKHRGIAYNFGAAGINVIGEEE